MHFNNQIRRDFFYRMRSEVAEGHTLKRRPGYLPLKTMSSLPKIEPKGKLPPIIDHQDSVSFHNRVKIV